jgi:dienelactone hydrolase
MAAAQTRANPAQIATRDEWARARQQTLDHMQLVMGDLPRNGRVPLDVVRHERVETPLFIRDYLTFAGGDDDRLPAYLFSPQRSNQRAPAMLCLHQTTRIGKGEPAGAGGSPDLHYAWELAGRGYVTLAPDYPNFGDYYFDPYAHGYASATMKAIRNHMRAVDLLQSLDLVDGRRIGCIGHSLGGHNTLFVACFDERIRALVTSCGFNSFKKYKGGNLAGWSHKGYMPRIADRYASDPAKLPFDFSDVLIALAPRPVFINAPLHDTNFEMTGVDDCVKAAEPVYGKVFAEAERLVVVHPDAGHSFPPEVRRQAYTFLERWV